MGKITVLFAALLLFACGKDSQDKGSGGQTEARGPGGAGTTGQGQPTAEGDTPGKPLSDLFPPGKPVLPPMLADVTLVETKLEAIDKTLREPMGSKLPDYPGTRLNISASTMRYDYSEDTANVIMLHLPNGSKGVELLTKAWGQPLSGPDNSGTRINGVELPSFYWFDPEAPLRVKFTHSDTGGDWITYTVYTPFEKLLGKKGELFGVEGKRALLGATVAEIRESWGKRVSEQGEKNAQIHLPGAELDTFDVTVLLRLTDKVVTEWGVRLFYGRGPEDRKKAYLDALTEKLGAPQELQRANQKYFLFPGDVVVELFDQDGMKSWEMTVKPVPTAAPAPGQ